MIDELRTNYAHSIRILKTERAMRQHVFRSDPSKMREKIAEIDLVLATLADLGLRLAIQRQAEASQPSLFHQAGAEAVGR